MKKIGKERLFEVMGRLDKTFKPKLNEDFGEKLPDEPTTMGGDELPSIEPEITEKTPEEKLKELTSKIDSLYAIVHDNNNGEEEEVENGEEESGFEIGGDENKSNEDNLENY
jgi:hypothetical protein